MKTIWPDQSGCLCARMSRGFNGQDAVGLLVVIKIIRGGVSLLRSMLPTGKALEAGTERSVSSWR